MPNTPCGDAVKNARVVFVLRNGKYYLGEVWGIFLLFHRVSVAVADRVTWAAAAVGVALEVTITVAQLAVHGPS